MQTCTNIHAREQLSIQSWFPAQRQIIRTEAATTKHAPELLVSEFIHDSALQHSLREREAFC